MEIDVKDRCVVVTGGMSGIGKEISKTFIYNGAKVAIVDIIINSEVIREMEQFGNDSVFSAKGDVTNEDSINGVIDDIVKKWNTIDILINNAGVIYKALIENTDVFEWRRLIDINLTGPMICTKKVVPFMKREKWGRIINISSMMAIIGAETYGAYAAAKAGLLQLTKVWATELASDGITVNAICPGWVETPMVGGFIQRIANIHNTSREEAIEKIFSLVPQKRFIDPKEIASLALFLASDMAKGINGAGIVIDTGLSAGMPAGLHRKLE